MSAANKALIVAVLFAVGAISVAHAQSKSLKNAISVRQWTKDIERFDEEVLRAMRDEFGDDDQACEEGRLGHYFDVYQEKLDALRDDIRPVTFLILREVMLANGRELGPMHKDLPCPQLNRWHLLETFIRSKIGLMGNSLTLLELSGAL